MDLVRTYVRSEWSPSETKVIVYLLELGRHQSAKVSYFTFFCEALHMLKGYIEV